ncbi:hypothetical protein FRX31_010073 [Thalictrum thalictroides]|uniref:Uncharacterized protein n=1 Tax=Thalictrum thalictroides TaxID=46969 RepID=A0A7J6WUD1_THATH|nr:hypothetical protein FRX31_010073 [Thalictrum thalictroides]
MKFIGSSMRTVCVQKGSNIMHEHHKLSLPTRQHRMEILFYRGLCHQVLALEASFLLVKFVASLPICNSTYLTMGSKF